MRAGRSLDVDRWSVPVDPTESPARWMEGSPGHSSQRGMAHRCPITGQRDPTVAATCHWRRSSEQVSFLAPRTIARIWPAIVNSDNDNTAGLGLGDATGLEGPYHRFVAQRTLLDPADAARVAHREADPPAGAHASWLIQVGV
jgi:hypothetical protein